MGHYRDYGVCHLEVFGDALREVSKINSSIFPANEDDFILNDVRKLCVEPSVHSISHIPRSCNVVAHNLPTYALTVLVRCCGLCRIALVGFPSLY